MGKWWTWLWKWPEICQLWGAHFPKAPVSKLITACPTDWWAKKNRNEREELWCLSLPSCESIWPLNRFLFSEVKSGFIRKYLGGILTTIQTLLKVFVASQLNETWRHRREETDRGVDVLLFYKEILLTSVSSEAFLSLTTLKQTFFIFLWFHVEVVMSDVSNWPTVMFTDWISHPLL